MTLPKLKHPIMEMTLPSDGRTIKYRPFLVGEEKILLMAQQGKEISDIINAITQVVNNCLVEDTVDVQNMPVFDLEYAFLTLRSKSVSDFLKFKIKDPETDEDVELELDLNNVKVQRNESHKNVIEVYEGTYLKMRYPSVSELPAIMDAKSQEEAFNVLIRCIESVIIGDEVTSLQEHSEEEILEFVDQLPNKCLEDIEKFFETIPRIRHEIQYKNSKGNDKTFVIEGTETFFI